MTNIGKYNSNRDGGARRGSSSGVLKVQNIRAQYLQRLAIRKFVVEKEDVFVNLPTYTGSGKSLINQAHPLVFNERGFAFGSADVRGLSVEHMKN